MAKLFTSVSLLLLSFLFVLSRASIDYPTCKSECEQDFNILHNTSHEVRNLCDATCIGESNILPIDFTLDVITCETGCVHLNCSGNASCVIACLENVSLGCNTDCVETLNNTCTVLNEPELDCETSCNTEADDCVDNCGFFNSSCIVNCLVVQQPLCLLACEENIESAIESCIEEGLSDCVDDCTLISLPECQGDCSTIPGCVDECAYNCTRDCYAQCEKTAEQVRLYSASQLCNCEDVCNSTIWGQCGTCNGNSLVEPNLITFNVPLYTEADELEIHWNISNVYSDERSGGNCTITSLVDNFYPKSILCIQTSGVWDCIGTQHSFIPVTTLEEFNFIFSCCHETFTESIRAVEVTGTIVISPEEEPILASGQAEWIIRNCGGVDVCYGQVREISCNTSADCPTSVNSGIYGNICTKCGSEGFCGCDNQCNDGVCNAETRMCDPPDTCLGGGELKNTPCTTPADCPTSVNSTTFGIMCTKCGGDGFCECDDQCNVGMCNAETRICDPPDTCFEGGTLKSKPCTIAADCPTSVNSATYGKICTKCGGDGFCECDNQCNTGECNAETRLCDASPTPSPTPSSTPSPSPSLTP